MAKLNLMGLEALLLIAMSQWPGDTLYSRGNIRLSRAGRDVTLPAVGAADVCQECWWTLTRAAPAREQAVSVCQLQSPPPLGRSEIMARLDSALGPAVRPGCNPW